MKNKISHTLWEGVEIEATFLEGNLVMCNKYTVHLLIELAITQIQKNLPLDKLVKVHQSSSQYF